MIAIVSILALALTPSILTHLNNSQKVICSRNIKVIVDKYIMDNSIQRNNKTIDYKTSELTDLFNSNKVCPQGGTIELSNDGTKFSINCSKHGYYDISYQ